MSRFQLLTDDQWALIADYLPAPTGKRGRPFSDPRQMIEGTIYRYRTGIAWRDLPETLRHRADRVDLAPSLSL